MRTLLLLIYNVVFLVGTVYSQQTINASITHDGLNREYILYVPAIYNESKPTPLVFNFHGFGSNAFEQMYYGDFRLIADTANFIIVHPQGTLFNNTTHFNVGGFTLGSTTDDVGFTSALIDSLSVQYSIDPDRIYATGMSNGGFMSFLLACQLNDRIAAVASVTGSMTPQTFTPCDPHHPTPILQIHGTTDPVVPYTGATWTKSIQAVLNFWIDHNQCNPNPIITNLPDVSQLDGSTVEHIVYSDGEKGTTVEHFKVTGGAHTWPGTVFGSSGTNQDFNASVEIWRFFARYNLKNLSETSSIVSVPKNSGAFSIFPNPATTQIIVIRDSEETQTYRLTNLTGHVFQTGKLMGKQYILNVNGIPDGVYLLQTMETQRRIVILH